VLFVTPYPPTPPMGGGRRRQLEILRRLATEANVTLATITFGDEDERLLPGIVPEGVEILTGRPVRGRLTRKLPLSLQWSWSAKLAGKIAEAHRANPFHLAVVSHSYAFHYAGALGDVPRMVDAQNVESRVYEQYSRLPRKDRAKIRRLAGTSGKGFIGASYSASRIAALEHAVWKAADLVVCVSGEEQDEISAAAPETGTILAPNCPSVPAGEPPRAARRSTVTFSGSLNYLPNIDAVICLAEQVAPRVRSLVSDVRFVVAGAQPSPRLVAYCKDHGLEVVPNPPDMAEVIAGTVMACPVRLIAGTRLKILDARDLGIPVVTTALAAEGLPVAGDPGVLVRDDPDGLARGLAEFLRADSWPGPQKAQGWQESLGPMLEAVRNLAR
jgi:glycosyltransferase involved in cell wall biosynthesis